MKKRLEIVKNIKVLCKWKDVNIITAEVCLDCVHTFLEVPSKLSVSLFVRYLK